MAMQDIRVERADQPHEAAPNQGIGDVRFAANGEAMDAQLQARRDLGQRGVGPFAARQAIGNQADVMAAFRLAVGEVEDMTEDSTNGCAHRVQDTKRLI
jgi:hypothetical protein